MRGMQGAMVIFVANIKRILKLDLGNPFLGLQYPIRAILTFGRICGFLQA